MSGTVVAQSDRNREIAGSSPGAAVLFIPEVSALGAQLRALLSLCSLPVHSAECTGNCM